MMTHDLALALGYGLTALALAIELVALWYHRRSARNRLAEAAAEALEDEMTPR